MSVVDYIDATLAIAPPVAVITLDRDGARNAYSEAMIASLMRMFDTVEQDTRVRAVILTGAGRAFSAGGDLKLMQAHAGMFEGDPVTLRANYLRGIHQVPRRLARFNKPLIAAINGAAIGAGLDLACMCDMRIASSRAKFGSTFVKVGLIPGDGGAYLLSRVVGFPRALELIMTGRIIDAAQALAINLVTHVVEPDELMTHAQALAEELAALPAPALRLAKSACYQSWDMSLDNALTLAATYQGIAQNTPAHDAAVEAMLTKRPTSKKP